jgi:hypothetical protein
MKATGSPAFAKERDITMGCSVIQTLMPCCTPFDSLNQRNSAYSFLLENKVH